MYVEWYRFEVQKKILENYDSKFSFIWHVDIFKQQYLKVFVSTTSQFIVLRELAWVWEKVENEEKVKSPNSIWFNKEQYRSLYCKGWSYIKDKYSSVWHFAGIQSSSSPQQNSRMKFQINDQSISKNCWERRQTGGRVNLHLPCRQVRKGVCWLLQE